MQGKEVIPAEEMVEKIHAGCDARRDPAFVIKARTDAFATHGLPEVLRRLTLYAEAGADLLFADALVSGADIATVARHVPKPLCVNIGFGIRPRVTTPLIAPEQLQALGVTVVIYPRLLRNSMPSWAMLNCRRVSAATRPSRLPSRRRRPGRQARRWRAPAHGT
jgi:2-methylisocitrate lyase-like PEP mutase family enzyme